MSALKLQPIDLGLLDRSLRHAGLQLVGFKLDSLMIWGNGEDDATPVHTGTLTVCRLPEPPVAGGGQ